MTSAPRKVVFAPNLIGAALISVHARRVLERWRDGEIIVVTNQRLISEHLRNLRSLGLPAPLLKRWAYWLASPERNSLFEKKEHSHLPNANSTVALCETIAEASATKTIICWKAPSTASRPLWITAEEFIKS